MKDIEKTGEDKLLHVIMTGPLPPLIGGMATVIEDISNSSLSKKIKLELFNTAKQTAEGRPLWKGIVSKIQLWSRWWSIINKKNHPIVHIHTCSGLTFFLDGTLLVLAKLRKCPSVLHIHGATFDKFLDSLPKILLYLAIFFFKKADRVVVLSEEWKEKLSQKLPDSSFTVIYNSVPVPSILNKKEAEIGKPVTVLFLGNLCKRKGIWELIKAIDKLPDSVHLIVAGGEEDPGIGSAIKTEIEKLGLDQRVRWIGPIVGREKQQLLLDADIFVLPSFAEGLPISLLEAMCSGLPVVATPVGGVPTVVSDGLQGLLVEAGNVELLSEAIEKLATDLELRKTLGREARNTCVTRFGIENAVERYMNMYEGLTTH
jgi:glycosyltransferase involved in cell wall biosynthesis